jgi:hypothetical protein
MAGRERLLQRHSGEPASVHGNLRFHVDVNMTESVNMLKPDSLARKPLRREGREGIGSNPESFRGWGCWADGDPG